MNPVTRQDSFLEYQIDKLVQEQNKTNQLLMELIGLLKPPIKEVEKVEPIGNDNVVKRKRR
jgi:hypothetical protein